MSQFKYTLPSGSTFTMTAPDGTTQTEADYIFYNQVASGALVGFVPGQSKSGTQTAAVKFALSRLDRGTAGIDDQVVLSIINGLPTISGIPNLINVPLENPITQANVVNIGANNTFTSATIGPLNVNQVQGLMAQVANFTNQRSDTITQTKGVGIYGLFCEQLEQAGYVKPGTYLQFIAVDPNDFITTMNSPGIWTGLNGIYSLDDFLNSLADQNTAQSTLMQNGYESLTATGVITPPVQRSVNAIQGYVYTQSGLQTISQLSATTGISIPSTTAGPLSASLNSLLSTPLTNVGSLTSGALNSIPGSLSNVSPALTSALTDTVTGGVGALVANASKFGTDAVVGWAQNSGLGKLTNLSNLNLGSISTALNGIPTTLTNLTNNIQGLDVLGKASQFATNFSNPLTSLSNLGNFNLSNLTSGVPNLSNLTSAIPNLSNLTSAIPNLSNLTSAVPGIGSIASLGNFGSLASFPGLGSLGSIGGLFGGGGDSLISATKVAAGFTNTVNRSVVDAAFVQVLGSSKIPVPLFNFPSVASLASKLDISQAQSVLQGLPLGGIGQSQITQLITLS
jgi:hypothetical protein